MGLFDFLNAKKEGPQSIEDKILEGSESSDVVIPTHVKSKIEEKPVETKKSSKSQFYVTGVYAVGGEVMLSGYSKSGVIKKKMKAKISDKESTVHDIKIGTESVKELPEKTSGTIFLKGKNLYTVRTEDVLEFK